MCCVVAEKECNSKSCIIIIVMKFDFLNFVDIVLRIYVKILGFSEQTSFW